MIFIYFLSPEAGQQARKEKKHFQAPQSFIFYRQRPVSRQGRKKNIFRPHKVFFSIARGRSAGKEGKKTFQAPKSLIFIYFLSPEAGQQARKEKTHFQAPQSFIFYRQRPVSRQGRKKTKSGPKKFDFHSFSIARGRSAGKEGKNTFSGPTKFYFLSPEAGQQARQGGKKLFRPRKVLFSIARGRSAGKEGKKTFSGPTKFYFHLFSIARSQSAGKEGKNKNQAPKSFIFYRQRPVSRQGRKKNIFRPHKVLFSIARGRSAGKEGKKTFQAPKSLIFIYFLSPEAGQQARKEKKTFQAPKSFIFYRQRPASWVDGCRSSRIPSFSRRALHLCNNVRDVTTQAQEAQRPIRLRFKNPCKRLWIVEKNFSEAEKFFPWGWTLERRPTSYFLPSN